MSVFAARAQLLLIANPEIAHCLGKMTDANVQAITYMYIHISVHTSKLYTCLQQHLALVAAYAVQDTNSCHAAMYTS